MSTEIKDKLNKDEISEYILFLNFISSMFRECDYVECAPLVSVKWEIALFTLNWNTRSKLLRYFARLTSTETRFIGSFFTRKLLSDGESQFPEHILLDTFPCFVFDSRALIPAKLQGLYFFANSRNCLYMENELIFSESYLIGSTEYNLHINNNMSQYDISRTEMSKAQGMNYPKFPNAFSASEKLVTPSGHSLRMYLEFTHHDASLCMFAYKIISNFFHYYAC